MRALVGAGPASLIGAVPLAHNKLVMFGTHAVLTYSGLRERSPEFWAGLRRLLVIAVDLRMGNLGRRRHLRATLLVSTVAALVFVLLVPTPVSAQGHGYLGHGHRLDRACATGSCRGSSELGGGWAGPSRFN